MVEHRGDGEWNGDHEHGAEHVGAQRLRVVAGAGGEDPPHTDEDQPGDHHHDGERPSRRTRQVGRGQPGDERVLDAELAVLALQRQQLETLPDEHPGQRDDERRRAGQHDPRALRAADRRTDGQGDHDRRPCRPPGDRRQQAHDAGRETSDRADRQVDLAEHQDQHHAQRQDRQGAGLQHEVRQVSRRQERVVGDLEADADEGQRHDDRPAPEVAAPLSHARFGGAGTPRTGAATEGALTGVPRRRWHPIR